MDDLRLEFLFIDRGGSAVFDVMETAGDGSGEYSVGRLRIPLDEESGLFVVMVCD